MKVAVPEPSMVNPSTDAMLKETHSRYTLVVLASKRARQLLAGAPCRAFDKICYKCYGRNCRRKNYKRHC